MTGAAVPPRRLRPEDWALLNYEKRGRHTSLEFGIACRFTTTALSASALRALVAARLPEVPDLTFVLDQPGHRWRSPQWRTTDPDLTWHVRDVPLYRVNGVASVARTLERAANTVLPRDRPLWEMLVLEPLDGSQWVALRVNHALFDAVSVIEVLRRLFGDRVTAASITCSPEQPMPLGRRLRETARLGWALPRMARRMVPLTGPAFTASGLTGQRRMAWAHLDDDRLRAAAARHGVTSNEAFLSALAGALREWPHTPWRRGIRPVWTFVPCDLRDGADPVELGNNIGALRIRLPCDEPDPVRRLHVVAAASSAEKARSMPVMRIARAVLPGWLIRVMFAISLSRQQVDIIASHVVQRGAGMTCAGGTMPEMMALGHLPRHRPLGALLVRHSGKLVLQVTADAGIADPGTLCRLWAEKVDELAALPPQGDVIPPRPSAPRIPLS
ncbi:wax ester/triacylglycerol synthase domain-containing protein [Allokutzneria oryzae]|uniref:diacylglycerol O-acyltransferase n=1 Tax=Allokutzneria oryzae TaxID=1378989 RepID=A0ABV6A902_9PSEU